MYVCIYIYIYIHTHQLVYILLRFITVVSAADDGGPSPARPAPTREGLGSFHYMSRCVILLVVVIIPVVIIILVILIVVIAI